MTHALRNPNVRLSFFLSIYLLFYFFLSLTYTQFVNGFRSENIANSVWKFGCGNQILSLYVQQH
jgi:hypothetical protein